MPNIVPQRDTTSDLLMELRCEVEKQVPNLFTVRSIVAQMQISVAEDWQTRRVMAQIAKHGRLTRETLRDLLRMTEEKIAA